MIRFSVNPTTMANLRFAYSPLIELTVSYKILKSDWQSGVYWRWLEEANRATHDICFPIMDELILSKREMAERRGKAGSYIPDFITPTPNLYVRDIEDEFTRILAMPDELIRDGIGTLMDNFGPSDILCDFMAHPHESLVKLIDEMREYWNRTLAHHWNRMVAVLENDVLYHSRILTLQGIEALFPELDKNLEYKDGLLTLHKKEPSCIFTELLCNPDFQIEGKNFYLTPVIFGANSVMYQMNQPWEPMLIYTPRGASLWNYETPEPSEALELTLGAGKARLLMALNDPLSTGELAHKLTLTAGAVSQQLSKLHDAGLVEYHRSGKHVFYRLSQRGHQLVCLFS
jgi:DNA-binding HxlR family transcriptional regulator